MRAIFLALRLALISFSFLRARSFYSFFARFFLGVISRKMTRRERLEDLKFVRSLASSEKYIAFKIKKSGTY